jgi:hypothetical protein
MMAITAAGQWSGVVVLFQQYEVSRLEVRG